MRLFNVLKHNVISSDKKLQTKEVQQAINEAAAKGLTLYFPKGIYVIGTIFLPDGAKIKLAKDALILGAPSFYDYAPQEKIDYPIYQDASHTYFDCAMFVGRKVNNISIAGQGIIDMRSVWDEDNVRDIVHRGPKCIALKECNNIKIEGIKILNATDLALYFAGCNNVKINKLYLKVFIDGISPDNSKDVVIKNCYVESGDDGIVFKSSYTLNRLDICKDILVKNCIIKSRCNAIKFGTETNGGFKDILITNCKCFDSRITGISVESVDGGHVDNIILQNITMNNVGSPFFVHLGQRLRGPKGTEIGSIKNIFFKNIKVTGPYHVYDCLPWNYDSFVKNETKQFPGFYSKDKEEEHGTWQITSNVCGLKDHLIENIYFTNIYMELDGGVLNFNKEVPLKAPEYPEVNVYGRVLPASAIYFRYVDGLKIKNFKVNLFNEDKRELFKFDEVKNCEAKY